MKLSIVSTLYKSATFISEFLDRVNSSARAAIGTDFEIILVNDGSPDDSLRIALELTKAYSNLVVIDLSKNFGHHKAIMTGLEYAKGDLIFLIDSDLEESPEWLAEFSDLLFQANVDVVFGVQESRKGGFFERISGDWFYRIFNLFSGLNLPANIVTARLMTKRYVNALLRHQEREVFLAGLFLITGFSQLSLKVSKLSRRGSTYSFSKKVSLLVNSITSFSNLPLISIFYIGGAISFIATSYIVFLILRWTFWSGSLSGWTSVMASIWLLGGLVISFMGIIGIYLSKVFVETKKRPYSIVRQIYKSD